MRVSTENRRVPPGNGGDAGRGRIGANLRHLIGMHDLSQRELADHLELSVQGLWNILHGRSEPRLRTAERIADAFAIPLECLFADTGTCIRHAAGSFEHAPVRATVAPAR